MKSVSVSRPVYFSWLFSVSHSSKLLLSKAIYVLPDNGAKRDLSRRLKVQSFSEEKTLGALVSVAVPSNLAINKAQYGPTRRRRRRSYNQRHVFDLRVFTQNRNTPLIPSLLLLHNFHQSPFYCYLYYYS